MSTTRSVYLSGQFEDGPVLRKVRDDLVRAGFIVTSRWLDSESTSPATATAHEHDAAARLAAIAYQDMVDIKAADLAVVFNPRQGCNLGRGGSARCHAETCFTGCRN